MTKLLDKICFIRDLITQKQYEKLKFYKYHIQQLKEEIHRQLKKKSQDYSYELEFTSQDLRELAKDIRDMFKRWESIMAPEKNIKEVYKNRTGNQININLYSEKVIPIMKIRTECIQPLMELLNLIEYHSVYLYYIEEASNDKFALELTERVI